MSCEQKAEEPKCVCDCDCKYLQKQIDDAWKDRRLIRKKIRIVLAILVDKKLIGEEVAKAFMESKQASPEIIAWAEAEAKFWIKKAKIKKGALRSKLGIKEGEKIPKSILSKIAKAEVGTKVSFNGKSITVTAQLKKQASLAQSFGKMKK